MLVVSSTENNQQIDVSDHDSDVEFCEEEEVMVKGKITQEEGQWQQPRERGLVKWILLWKNNL